MTQLLQASSREAWWLMEIEPRGTWLGHPGRNLSQSAVWQDDGAELFSLICYALAQRDYRSVVRMKSVVDGDFFVLLFVGMM